MSHTVNNWTLSLTRYKHIHLFSCSSLPALVLWCQQRKLIFKKGWESAGNCPSLWGFAATCGAFTETWPFFHLSLPSVTCLQQTELTRADLPPLNRLPPLVSALSQRLPISSCPSSSWVISRTLELLPSIDGTATGGMLSLGELSVVRGNSLSIKRAGKGIVVFYQGDFCEALLSKMQQPGSCFLWAFKGGARWGRIRWWGDTSQHRPSPKPANPASVKVRSDVLILHAELNLTCLVTPSKSHISS